MKKIDLSKYGIIFAWITLVIVFSICEPSFLKPSNIFNIGVSQKMGWSSL